MKSCRWELFRYSLPLKEPLRMLGNESKERNGLILRLSEESADIAWDERKSWQSYWLVDPLDGTKEFIKKNGGFTVNISLI